MAVFAIFSQGFKQKLVWVGIGLFFVVRIAGVMFEPENIYNPANTSDAKWLIVPQSVGISHLFMANYGLLSRSTDIISGYAKAATPFEMQNGGYYKPRTSTSRSLRNLFIQIMHIPTIIALILCIVGASREFDGASSKISSGRNLTESESLFMYECILSNFPRHCHLYRSLQNPKWTLPPSVLGRQIILQEVRLLCSVLAAFTPIK
ncbi:hypothetical protein EAF00_007705 [Botryotinia globosa]|nr:hypothetical protein EAF00_007705 [Botryotinia globosa]